MFELIVEGPLPRQRVRFELAAGRDYVLGRDGEADLPVLWDPHISRRHVRLTAGGEHVEVERLGEAHNPLFFAGRSVDSCRLRGGEHFVLGSTSLQVLERDREFSSPGVQPVEEVTFDPQELRKVRFRDADKRIEVLSHLSEVIWGARSDREFYHRLANLILTGVSHAEAVAIVELDEHDAVGTLHWERRRETAGAFRPSARLAVDALRKERRSVLHVWDAPGQSRDYTAVAEFDWAFCTPVIIPSGETWGLYVAGRLDLPSPAERAASADRVSLQADVKFTEIVAEIVASVRQLSRLERMQSALRQFFAPQILSALGNDLATLGQSLDAELFKPRECDVTVLFCDLRGFSHQAEESADNLIGLLDQVSRALGVMTHEIRRYGGVTGDFQGDSTLAFWGWPIASDEAPLDACRAALAIRAAFEKTRGQADHPLANFEMGIGIAHGRAVAGKIGTSEKVEFTVFGPVVNLASRLEGMTKPLRVPIVVDEATADIVRRRLDPKEGRIRRLAKVLPYGIETPVVVSELLPPVSWWPELTDAHLEQYERGVEHFVAGRWEEAYKCLHKMPDSDRAQDFLSIQIAQHNRVAPEGWDGIVRLANK